MEDRIIRQNSLEGVRKSESVNLMSPKSSREWQKQNHSIHPFYNFSLNIQCDLPAEMEHFILFSMTYIYTLRLLHRSNPSVSQLPDDPLLQTLVTKEPFLLTFPGIFLQKCLLLLVSAWTVKPNIKPVISVGTITLISVTEINNRS